MNESGNADVEYLSDGMTETLISSLSQLPNLKVKARSSVFRYKGRQTDAKTIGKDLKLDPTFPWTHSHISYVYRMKGDRADSVEEGARAFELLDRADQARRMRDSFATSWLDRIPAGDFVARLGKPRH